MPVILQEKDLPLKKRKIEVVVISDVHLGSPTSRAEELLTYLSSIKPKILVLNGNIIQSVKGRNNAFPQSHIRVVKKILCLLSEGTKVYHVTGDRDQLLAKINGRMFGELRFQDRVLLDLDGKTTCILHGSMFDTSPTLARWLVKFGSLGYKALRIKHRLEQRWGAGKGRDDLSRGSKIASLNAREYSTLSKFDQSAVNMALQNNYDTLICGYSHQPRKVFFESRKGQCLYLNSGDWTEHLTALEYSFKRWKIYNFKFDKLTAFYGDEELKEIRVPELLRDDKASEGSPAILNSAS